MSYLLRNRIIFVGARIDDQVRGGKRCQQRIIVHMIYHTLCTLRMGSCVYPQLATQTVAQMLALEAIDPTADIRLYINSAGPVRQTRHDPCVCLPLATFVAPPAIMD
jgi:ATP-dependent protease ClpP protease subunit